MKLVKEFVHYLFVAWLIGCPLISDATSQKITPINPTESLEHALSNYTKFKAEFTKAVYSQDNQIKSVVKGRLAVAQPKQFYWELEGNKLIMDGDYLWDYDLDLQQAVRYSFKKNLKQSPLALFVLPDELIADNFQVTELSAQANGVSKTKYVLIPNTQDNFTKLEIIFYQENAQQLILQAILLWDVTGQRTELLLENIQHFSGKNNVAANSSSHASDGKVADNMADEIAKKEFENLFVFEVGAEVDILMS